MNTTTISTINSLRQLATALGRSSTTAHNWTHHPEWTFSRSAPWDASDIDEMKRWATDTLAPDPIRASDDDDPFWRGHVEHPPIRLPRVPDGLTLTKDELAFPAALCGELEREVLSGKRQLSPASAREVMRVLVRLRALLFDSTNWLPSWLRGESEAEIARRMRAVLGDKIGWSVLCCQIHREELEGSKTPRTSKKPLTAAPAGKVKA